MPLRIAGIESALEKNFFLKFLSLSQASGLDRAAKGSLDFQLNVSELDAPGYCRYQQCLGMVFTVNFFFILKPLSETQQLREAWIFNFM
jgi:hypothetical protein